MKRILLFFVLAFSMANMLNARFVIMPHHVSNLEPQPPKPSAFTKGIFGPYYSGDNAGDSLINLCNGSNVSISAISSLPGKTDVFQWYACIGTVIPFPLPGKDPITWTSWTSIKSGTSNKLTFTADFIEKNQIVVFACKYTQLGTTKATNYIGFISSGAPSMASFTVSAGYVCPGEDVVLENDFDVSGTGITAYWEERPGSFAAWSEYENDNKISPLVFNGPNYMYNGYDYRLVMESSCLDTTFPSLKDYGVSINIGVLESYSYPTSMTLKTCLNEQVNTGLSLGQSNSFYSYSYKWEKQNSGSSTWEIISSDNGGVFSNYTTINLGIAPNLETYNGMKFRCTTYGACDTLVSNIFTLEMNVPAEVTNIVFVNDTVCKGGTLNCAAVVSSNPLSKPIQYNWKVDGNAVGGEGFGISDSLFSYTLGTEGATITCQVRNANECSSNIDEYNKPIRVYNDPEVTINVTETGCGAATANLTAEVVKGKAPYSYLWAFTAFPTTSTSQTLAGMPANAAYAVSVTDNCSNDDTASVYISSFPILAISYLKEDVLCFGQKNGSINALAIGGVTPYTITISKKVGMSDSTISSYSTSSGIITMTDLYAGEYKIIVNDACGNEESEVITINQPNKLVAVVSDYQNVSCRGLGDGYAEIAVTGGVLPYAVTWSNNQTNLKTIGLFAGDYIANIVDDNGCFVTKNITIEQPEEFKVSYDLQKIVCHGANNGQLNVFIQGGKEPFTTELTLPNDSVKSGTTFSDLKPGDYSLYVSDFCGNLFEEEFTLVQPDELSYSSEIVNITCNGRTDGSVEISGVGGYGSYRYYWSDSSTSNSLNGLSAGDYYLTVYDSPICGDSIETTITISQPEVLASSISSTNISCYGAGDGSATINVSGGTEPYLYSWSNGQNLQNAIGLFPGIHTVNVIDANGCITTGNVTITQPEMLSVKLGSTYTNCGASSGIVYAEPLGGTAPYSLIWDIGSSADTIYSLAEGVYSVTITDYNGCSISDSIYVTTDIDPVEICMVTVDPELIKNQIVWTKEYGKGIKGYNIYKLDYFQRFKLLSYVPFDSISYCIDGNSKPKVTPDYYAITAIDECGNESEMSDYHKTLHLNVSESSQTNGYALTWSHYEGFDFTSYIIYRGSSPDSLEPIDTIVYDIGNYTYTDLSAPIDKFSYYQIGALRTLGSCSATKASSGPFSQSISNIEDNRLRDDKINYNSDIKLVKIYPNPSEGIFNLEYSLNTNSVVEITVSTITGITVFEKESYSSPETMKIEESGIYLVRIKVNNSVIVKRVTVL